MHFCRSVCRCFSAGAAALLSAAALCFATASAETLAQSDGRPNVSIGSIRLSQPSESDAQIARALDALKDAFEARGYAVEIDFLTTDQLGARIKRHGIDIFVASGGFYRSHIPEGARDIATLFDPRSDSPNRGIASSIVVRKDRQDVGHLGDLKGKSIALTYPNAFTGNAYAMGEVAQRGFDPDNFFSRRLYRFPASRIIDSVLEGEADGGVIVSCLLEEMRAAGDSRAEKLRVIDPKTDDGLRCAHTSELYPSWTFATTPRATPEESTIATAALLGLAPSGDGWQWSVATDFSRTDELLKTLRIGPYSILKEWTFSAILKRYSAEITVALIALLMLIAHSFILSLLVKRKTEALTKAHEREMALEQERQEAGSRLEQMQRVGTIGQMCSMLAHELKQPLSVIRYSARAQLRLLENLNGIDGMNASAGPADVRGKLEAAAQSIHREALRTNEIVERVRSYARQQRAPLPVDVKAAARAALENLKTSGRNLGSVVCSMPEAGVMTTGDPLEIELAIVNLLKNAGDAVKDEAHPLVRLSVESDEEEVRVRVTDNGPRLSNEAFANLAQPLHTGKTEGLGLGLVIARSIAELAGGGLSFERAPGGGKGLSAVLTFARRTNDDQE